ncbi:hypothetical protein A7982_13287 [Minicystis rosea]|nr:hypothetical protein A7982_13287 [Minicystis rosea]
MNTALRIDFRMSIPMPLDGEPSQFIVEYCGRILDMGSEDEPEGHRTRTAGRIRATRIHVGLAEEHAENLLDVFDAHSQEMLELYEAIFDHETDEIWDSVAEKTSGQDVLFVNSIELLPRYRGRRLGLQALQRTMEFLGTGCAVTVVEAHPIDYDQVQDERWVQRMRLKRFKRDVDAAAKRLRQYWSRLGFKRAGRTNYLTFDMAYRFKQVAEPNVDTPDVPLH